MAEVAQFRLEHRGVSPSFELHLLDLPISDLPILDLPIFELPILVTKLLILCMGDLGTATSIPIHTSCGPGNWWTGATRRLHDLWGTQSLQG
jgi:hypothetical protein